MEVLVSVVLYLRLEIALVRVRCRFRVVAESKAKKELVGSLLPPEVSGSAGRAPPLIENFEFDDSQVIVHPTS